MYALDPFSRNDPILHYYKSLYIIMQNKNIVNITFYCMIGSTSTSVTYNDLTRMALTLLVQIWHCMSVPYWSPNTWDLLLSLIFIIQYDGVQNIHERVVKIICILWRWLALTRWWWLFRKHSENDRKWDSTGMSELLGIGCEVFFTSSLPSSHPWEYRQVQDGDRPIWWPESASH